MGFLAAVPMTTLQTASMILTGVGAIASAYGAYQQGQLQAAAAAQQAKAMEQQARLYEMQALDAQNRAAREAALLREQGERIKGQQRAVMGASGVQLAGSPMDVIMDTQRSIEIDVATIKQGGAREAWGYSTQAWAERAQAQQTAFAGSVAKQQGRIGAFGNLLTGATAVADQWYNYRYRM